MRRQLLALPVMVLLASGCHLFGTVRLTEVATAAGKPSNIAVVVSVTRKGQPVADLGLAAFRLSENDQVLDPKAVDLRLLEPATVAAFHTVLLLDLGHANTDERRRQLARGAAAFVRRARQKQGVTVIAFDGSQRTRLVGDFTPESNGTGPEQLEKLLLMSATDPSRNLNGAVVSALDILDSRLARSNRAVRVGTLVVFSRGPDVAGRIATTEFDDRVSLTKHQLVYVNVAGDPTGDRTTALATGGRIESQSADTVPIAFEDAAILANKLSSQYYLISYCSPARAGERNLYVEVQVSDANGDADTDSFETSFDSTGFSPSCNAGSPPRFSIAQHATSDRSSGASRQQSPTPAPTDSNTNNHSAIQPPPAAEKPGESETEVEVPPPKNRGYAQ